MADMISGDTTCNLRVGFYTDATKAVYLYARSDEGDTWYQCIGTSGTGKNTIVNVIATNFEEASMYLDMLSIGSGYRKFTSLKHLGTVEGFDNSRHDICNEQDNPQDTKDDDDTPNE